MKNNKVKGTWATYRDENDDTRFTCHTDEVAEMIERDGLDAVPARLTIRQKMEVYVLAKGYLSLLKQVKELKGISDEKTES